MFSLLHAKDLEENFFGYFYSHFEGVGPFLLRLISLPYGNWNTAGGGSGVEAVRLSII